MLFIAGLGFVAFVFAGVIALIVRAEEKRLRKEP